MTSLSDACVCCGVYVPEGSMVCPECLRKYARAEETKRSQIKEIRPFIRLPTHFLSKILKKAP